ncbi:MAG: Arm DNA-binding domain-containing protein [Bacteroidales bacterium]
MNATIEAVCCKSKVLTNNESPLMSRVTKDRKRQYQSLGFSLETKYWDFEKNKPRRKSESKEREGCLISIGHSSLFI